jgi:hypothetical protein
MIPIRTTICHLPTWPGFTQGSTLQSPGLSTGVSIAKQEPYTVIPKSVTLDGRPVPVGSFKPSGNEDKALLAALLRPQSGVQEADLPTSMQVVSKPDDKWHCYHATFSSNGENKPVCTFEVYTQSDRNGLKYLTAKCLSHPDRNDEKGVAFTKEFDTRYLRQPELSQSEIHSNPSSSVPKINFDSQSQSSLAKRLQALSELIESRTQLSTTGYQTAMSRLNNTSMPDNNTLMTKKRAQEYTKAAKRAYPSETLKSLAELQINQIYRTSDGRLLAGIEMTPTQLTECLMKCREVGFSNCDMQALEIAIHIQHCLGIKDFTIFGNKKISHNYVVINKSKEFPKGPIVDSWTGKGLQELNFKNKLIFKHREDNLEVNKNMHEWVSMHGSKYIIR